MLLAIFGQMDFPYSSSRLDVVWRLSYGLALIPLLFLLPWRFWRERESTVWMGKTKAMAALHAVSRRARSADDNSLFWQHYWHRIFGTAGCWFLWCARPVVCARFPSFPAVACSCGYSAPYCS